MMVLACSGCGAMLEDGPAGCQARSDQLRMRHFIDRAHSRFRRLMEDTYYLQHPDRFCVSGKSFAAHLTGLCCACEHSSDPAVFNALEQWLHEVGSIDKPDLPTYRGVLTIVDVQGFADSALHPLAEQWLRQALARRSQ